MELRIAALWTATAVALGAFGAHGLRDLVTPARLAVWEKAVLYHLVHGIALVAISLFLVANAASTTSNSISGAFKKVFWVMLAGSGIFSCSLYLLVATDTPWLGAITPLGGTLLIISWALLGLAVKTKQE